MTLLNKVRIMNDTMITYQKKLGIDYQRNNIIKKIFEDDACFFKMTKEDALLILKEVGIQDNLEETYSKLTSSDLYYDLYKTGKINENDKELVIRHKLYSTEDLFKKNNHTPYKKVDINKNTSLIDFNKQSFLQNLFDKIKNLFTKK